MTNRKRKGHGEDSNRAGGGGGFTFWEIAAVCVVAFLVALALNTLIKVLFVH